MQTHNVGIGNSDPIEVTIDTVYSRSTKIVSGYPSTCKKTSSKGTLLYSTLSSPWDCSTYLPVHPLVHLFIPTPSQLLREAFSHAAIILRRLFVHISTTVSSCVLIYSGNVGKNCESFDTAARGFEPGLLQLTKISRHSHRVG